MINRRKAIRVSVGNIAVGGSEPVRVQSMTNTPTEDIEATAKQVSELAECGSELVRLTVNTEKAAQAVPEIKKRIREAGVTVPLIGDFHYNGHLLLKNFPELGKSLDKFRINPGNVGRGANKNEQFDLICKMARDLGKPIRIGVNGGSLDPDFVNERLKKGLNRKTSEEILCDCMIASALESESLARKAGLNPEQIVLSAKTTNTQSLIKIYRELSLKTQAPLHLGLTEAGVGERAVVASSAALAVLLQAGIGDTIRVSLSPLGGETRTKEVVIAQEILQSLGIRFFSPEVIVCPGCGRTSGELFERLASGVDAYVRREAPEWKKRYQKIETLKIAVMGCIVNGPGESKSADIGISLPGAGEEPKALVYAGGKLIKTLEGPADKIIGDFCGLLDTFLHKNFSSK